MVPAPELSSIIIVIYHRYLLADTGKGNTVLYFVLSIYAVLSTSVFTDVHFGVIFSFFFSAVCVDRGLIDLPRAGRVRGAPGCGLEAGCPLLKLAD